MKKAVFWALLITDVSEERIASITMVKRISDICAVYL
jgi:hypothetical protein